MEQLDDRLKRATADAVYWMKRYYNLRMLVKTTIESTVPGDSISSEEIRVIIAREEYQDVLNDPNGVKTVNASWK